MTCGCCWSTTTRCSATGSRAALAGADDLEVVGEAEDVAGGAGARPASCPPDLVLMDLNLPDGVGHRGDPGGARRAPAVRGSW